LEFDETLAALRKAATTGYAPAMYTLGKFMVANHEEGGHTYMREAVRNGYVPPESGEGP
jgi:hypothetical protein